MYYILSIDQGTTGSTALIIDSDLNLVGRGYCEFEQLFPKPGYVEHRPQDIISSVNTAVTTALSDASLSFSDITAIGITNQRETVVAWDAETRTPLHNAIVWQCGRSTALCEALRRTGVEDEIRQKTGLLLNPYFSGSKIKWLLDEHPDWRTLPSLRLGTMDTYLIDYFTNGASFVTDHTNASRTLLYNIDTQSWDDGLLDLFGVPKTSLPDIQNPVSLFGHTNPDLTGGVAIPIWGVAGDQQSALFGQGCVTKGMSKSTYGTGAFLLQYDGTSRPDSYEGLLTTIAVSPEGQPAYATEGAIFIAGAAVQWLRDGLGVIDSSSQSESLATSVADSGGVMMVPAFTGLGAPYWQPDARGVIVGIDRGTTAAHITRATLESIAYQTRDLLSAMGMNTTTLAVDGGVTENQFLMQYMADVLNIDIVRPVIMDTTALGAAMLAGIGADVWENAEMVHSKIKYDKTYTPNAERDQAEQQYSKWQETIRRYYL